MTRQNWEPVLIGIISVFVGFVAFAFTQSIFNLFFVPIVVYLIWDNDGKMKEIRTRLAELETKSTNENR